MYVVYSRVLMTPSKPNCIVQFVGMLMVLSMTTFIRTVVVLGPASPPSGPSLSPMTLVDILKYGNVDGAVLLPVQIEYVKSNLFSSCSLSQGRAPIRFNQSIERTVFYVPASTDLKLTS